MSARSHPSALTWARALAGELGWLARTRLRRHLAGCDACRRLQAEQDAERRAFEADPRRAEDLSRLEARAARAAVAARPSAVRAPRLAVGLVGVAVATGLAVVVARRPATPELAAKGADLFQLLVDGPRGAQPLGARCAPGDRLMARFRTDRPFVLLLERDGAGRVQALLPAGGAESARVEGGEGTTPESWILDSAPGPECFVAVFSDAPVGVAAATRALLDRPQAPALPGAAFQVRCCEKERAR